MDSHNSRSLLTNSKPDFRGAALGYCGEDLLEIIVRRYERASTLLTSNR
jgi:hypothetical protein